MYGYSVSFDVGTHTWQFKAGVIDPIVGIESITVYAMFSLARGYRMVRRYHGLVVERRFVRLHQVNFGRVGTG